MTFLHFTKEVDDHALAPFFKKIMYESYYSSIQRSTTTIAIWGHCLNIISSDTII